MKLGKHLTKKNQVRVSGGHYLVACCSQEGATDKTFNKRRLEKEVLSPIQKLLRSKRVDYAIIAVPHNPSCLGAEGLGDFFGEDGPPAHKIGLTTLAVVDLWKDNPLLDKVILLSDEKSKTPEQLLRHAMKKVPLTAGIIHVVKLGEKIPSRV